MIFLPLLLYQIQNRILIPMNSSVYRRNYCPNRACQNVDPEKQGKQRLIYDQTVKVINEMLSQIKQLLSKINILKGSLQKIHKIEELTLFDKRLIEYKQYAKALQSTFLTLHPLQNKMTGAFVMRLIKEIGYWKIHLPFLSNTISEIERVFEQQQAENEQNISLLYFITIKKIIADYSDIIQKFKAKIKSKNEVFEKPQPNIFLVPTFNQSLNGQNLRKLKNDFEQMIHQYNITIYRGLDIQSNHVVSNILMDLTNQENIDQLSLKQLARNKKIKKQIKFYNRSFVDFLERKKMNRERRFRVKELNSTSIKKLFKSQASKKFNKSVSKLSDLAKLQFPLLQSNQINDKILRSISQEKYKKPSKQKQFQKGNIKKKQIKSLLLKKDSGIKLQYKLKL